MTEVSGRQLCDQRAPTNVMSNSRTASLPCAQVRTLKVFNRVERCCEQTVLLLAMP